MKSENQHSAVNSSPWPPGGAGIKPYYVDESVCLFCGDCREILPTIAPVDHVITDPPFEAEAHTLQRRVKRADSNGSTVMSVEPLDFAPMTETDRDAAGVSFGLLAKRWTLVFCQVEASQLWRSSCERGGMIYRRTCIWVKPDGMPQFSGDRPGMGYETFVAMHAAGKSTWNAGGRHGVYVIPKGAGAAGKGGEHPTTKPEPLMVELVTDFTDPGETILDPFAGSGTTLVAAKRLGRKSIGVELSEKYCEIAARRLSQGALDLFGT